jgi:hypothetical protein
LDTGSGGAVVRARKWLNQLDHKVREGEVNLLVRIVWLVVAQQRWRWWQNREQRKSHGDLGHIYKHDHSDSHWKARVVALSFLGTREKVLDAAQRLAGAHVVRCLALIRRAL